MTWLPRMMRLVSERCRPKARTTRMPPKASVARASIRSRSARMRRCCGRMRLIHVRCVT